jgi:outer membrane receptor for ferrienterochelin and colicins
MRDRKFPILQLLIFFVLCSAPLTCLAQASNTGETTSVNEEMILFQEIPSVFGASKYDQKVTEAPSSVSIITARDIKLYGYRTLADILNSVKSFYVTYDRNYSSVGVRGFGRPEDYNNRILLVIDGHRMNDNLYDMAFIGTDGVLDVDLIDRVEIIRGPGSSLYGSNAFFAVVNVITRRGRDLKGTEFSSEAAGYETYKGRLSYGNRFSNGLEAILSGSSYGSKGQQLYYPEFDPATPLHDPRAANGGNTVGTDYDRYISYFAKSSFRDFTFEGGYVSRTKGIPTASFGTDFNDPGNKTTDARGYGDLRYEHNLGRQTDLTVRLFYDWYRYDGYYVYSGVLNKDLGIGESWGSEMKISTMLFDIHRIIAGLEYQDNTRLDQKNYDIDPYTLYLDDNRSSQRWAAYAQDKFDITPRLSLTAGARYDHSDTLGDSTNPRLALIFVPREKSSVKLLYGTAFREPSPFELYYQSSTNMSNPDLKPEMITTYELVYEQFAGDQFHATASAYTYRITDLINQAEVAPSVTAYRNLNQVNSRGFEIALENKWPNSVDGRISYTLQKTVDSETNEVLSNSPEHLVKFAMTVPLVQKKLFAGIEEQYTSRRKTLSGNYTNDFYITNLTVFSQRILRGFELSASVYNLLDRKYGDPVSADLAQQTVLQDGRTYRVKLTYAF